MGIKRVMVLVEQVDLSTVRYEQESIQAPHLTGFLFRFFVRIVEAPLIGPSIISILKKSNKVDELLRNTVIPEEPMFKPEYPPQEKEPGVVILDEDGRLEDRIEAALNCLPNYDPAAFWGNSSLPFQYWKIRDYAYAYRSGKVTPSVVSSIHLQCQIFSRNGGRQRRIKAVQEFFFPHKTKRCVFSVAEGSKH